jgi:hypothetical protein
MALIEDVLEYASQEVGITVDLLAAVAWAESKMLLYAINLKGRHTILHRRSGRWKRSKGSK